MAFAREFRRLVAPLLNDELAIQKNVVYWQPVRWTLCGVLAESSRSGRVYLWSLVMPLFVPHDVVYLDWSERIGGGSATYDLGAPGTVAVLQAGLAQARDHFRSPEPLPAIAPAGVENFTMQEARAYALCLTGDFQGAREVLTRVLRITPEGPWDQEVVDRAQLVAAHLDAGEHRLVHELLSTWQRETVANLGLN